MPSPLVFAERRAQELWSRHPLLRYALADIGTLTQILFDPVKEGLDLTIGEYQKELRARCVAGAERAALVRNPAFARSQSSTVERQGSRLIVWLYGALTASDGPLGSCNGGAIVKAIDAAKDAQALIVRISSHGGSAYAVDCIMQAMHRFRGRKIAIVDHFAVSAGACVACFADRVVMRENALIRLHNTSTVVADGNADYFSRLSNELRAGDSRLYAHIASKRVIDMNALHTLVREDRYVGAEEALQLGLCDAITRRLDASDQLIAAETSL